MLLYLHIDLDYKITILINHIDLDYKITILINIVLFLTTDDRNLENCVTCCQPDF